MCSAQCARHSTATLPYSPLARAWRMRERWLQRSRFPQRQQHHRWANRNRLKPLSGFLRLHLSNDSARTNTSRAWLTAEFHVPALSTASEGTHADITDVFASRCPGCMGRCARTRSTAARGDDSAHQGNSTGWACGRAVAYVGDTINWVNNTS